MEAKLTAQKNNTNVLVFGQKGYGKTSLVRGMVSNQKRLVIMDTLQYEYDDDGEICVTYEDAVKYLDDHREEFRAVCRFPEDERFWRLLEGMNRTTFLIEEMDNFANLYNIPEPIARHYKYGRHKENNMIAVSRHAQEVNVEIRKNSDVVISFRQEEPNVLKYLAQINEVDTRKLPGLAKGQYVILKGHEYLAAFIGEEIKPPEREGTGDLFPTLP